MMTLVAGPLWMALMPDDGSSWKVRAVQVPIFSVGTATMLTVAQERFRRSFSAVLTDLDATQRRHAIQASQRGDIPSDPAILSTALRLCELAIGSRLRSPLWARRIAQWMPAFWVLMAIIYFLDHAPRRGIIWLGLSLLMAIIVWRDARLLQRLQKRLESLRAAAGTVLGEVPSLAEEDYPPVMPTRKTWLITFGVLIVMAVAVGFGTYVTDRPRRECRTGLKSVTVVLDHRDLVDSRVIRPDGPSLAVFEDWSKQLHDVAARVTRADLAPRVRRIADLSDQAVSVMRHARESPGTQTDQVREGNAYLVLIKQILDETLSIQDTCYPH